MDGKKQQIPPLRYAPVGMTNSRAETSLGAVRSDGRQETADPSTALRSGRDDKFETEKNNRSLHYAALRSG